MNVPGFDDIYMDLAQTLARKSHCVKMQVGAVLTKDTKIISLGYNGRPQALTIAIRNGLKPVVRATAKVDVLLQYMPNKMQFYMLPKTMYRLKELLFT